MECVLCILIYFFMKPKVTWSQDFACLHGLECMQSGYCDTLTLHADADICRIGSKFYRGLAIRDLNLNFPFSNWHFGLGLLDP